MTLSHSVYRIRVQRRRILNCVFHSILHVSDSRSDRQSACQERLAVIQQCHSASDLASSTDSALSQPLLVCQLAVDRASLTHSAPSSPLLVCVFLCRRRWTLRCDQRFLRVSWSTLSFGMRLVTGRTGVKSSTLSSFCGATILSVMRLRPNGFSSVLQVRRASVLALLTQKVVLRVASLTRMLSVDTLSGDRTHQLHVTSLQLEGSRH